MTDTDIGARVDRDFAEAWRPDPGDTIVGEVTDLGQRNGYDDTPYPIITVRREDGTELAFHAFHTVARNELAAARPQVGERIALKYLGPKSGADGRSKYHAYRVAVDRPAPTFAWERFGGEAVEPPVEPDIPSGVNEFDKTGGDDDLPF